uniref:Uncharacterized protein n=1 Tax=Parascaris equorum TaxID=6256 RepID=A0A914RSB0_PAREQ
MLEFICTVYCNHLFHILDPEICFKHLRSKVESS